MYLPVITLGQNALTEEAAYPSEDNLSVNDHVMIILDSDGTVMKIVKQDITPGSGQGGNPSSGDTDRTGQTGSSVGGGGSSGGGSMESGTQTQTFTLYSLNKITVVSVTSQENMGVSITVDELDITKLYVGQKATKSKGVYEGETKTGSMRAIRLAPQSLELLRKWKTEQLRMKLAQGDRWADSGYIFTQDDGSRLHPDSITDSPLEKFKNPLKE